MHGQQLLFLKWQLLYLMLYIVLYFILYLLFLLENLYLHIKEILWSDSISINFELKNKTLNENFSSYLKINIRIYHFMVH